MSRTRQEHLQWCKDRANAYLDKGDIQQGVTSMLSDMGKHPETDLDTMLKSLGLMALMSKDLNEAKSFVDGFA